ncbi:hypothetical protein D3C73_1564880 [compost metagenome]
MLAYPINWLYEYSGYYRLVNYRNWHIRLISIGLSAIAYWAQMWQDSVIKKDTDESPLRSFRDIKLFFKEKAR